MRDQALQMLRQALDDPAGDFRSGQWECIQSLLKRERLLVVQRTGWGKSMVYFIATRLLRDEGRGPTLLISPLLSLMRNQLAAAERVGIRAATINSANTEEWEQIEQQITADTIDILLISPERLANDTFRQNVLASIAPRVGLLVVDEAHCISDWGHDFRPDYRRIVRVLQALPTNIPVLATTATANNRVVNDVVSQLGNIATARGPLVRKSLKLQNISLPSPAARMAWLAQYVNTLPGSGIVYTLTKRDAERLTEWLQQQDIAAEAYHADVDALGENTHTREELEARLLNNEMKVLVATVALGMGFDKPDIGFVIHYQRPGSVAYYYQQVGRAGRAVDDAYGLLFCGEEDDHIVDFFIRSAFPPQMHIDRVLQALDAAEDGLSVPMILEEMNLTKGQLEKTLKYLSVEDQPPIGKRGPRWYRLPVRYEHDESRVEQVTAQRRAEQDQTREYMEHGACLMEFLEHALDDPEPHPCGRCANCEQRSLVPLEIDEQLIRDAVRYLRRHHFPIPPRKRWPAHNPFSVYVFSGNISEDLQATEGRALCLWRDAGWGQSVAVGKYESGSFDDELVSACVDMLEEWNPEPRSQWITCTPSLNHPELVPGFARRLAEALRLPFVECIQKARENQQQKLMQNSFQQCRNLDGAFRILQEQVRRDPVLLVGDMVDSRWTFTVLAALLRQAGCPSVLTPGVGT